MDDIWSGTLPVLRTVTLVSVLSFSVTRDSGHLPLYLVVIVPFQGPLCLGPEGLVPLLYFQTTPFLVTQLITFCRCSIGPLLPLLPTSLYCRLSYLLLEGDGA